MSLGAVPGLLAGWILEGPSPHLDAWGGGGDGGGAAHRGVGSSYGLGEAGCSCMELPPLPHYQISQPVKVLMGQRLSTRGAKSREKQQKANAWLRMVTSVPTYLKAAVEIHTYLLLGKLISRLDADQTNGTKLRLFLPLQGTDLRADRRSERRSSVQTGGR